LPIALAIAAMPFAVSAQESTLTEVVVTAPQMSDPLVVVTDPKAPQVPVPANDGASFLKNIPGFNVIRKGGTDGDPVLRGLAGSRLNVLLDGAEFHGGCGQRMDPPTAYVFPEVYDKVTVIKGPQTVRYGNGNLAGVVLFDREAKSIIESGVQGVASVMAGSWDRLDVMGEVTAGTPDFYVRGSGTYSDSDDYEDGDGSKVHSAFNRKSVNIMGGWTPDPNTRLELSAVRSEAEAAYADRAMDGVIFDRDGYGIKFEKKRISDVLRKVEAQYNYNYIDHVMDNYSLRNKLPAANYMWNNPDRETKGLRASADLGFGPALLTVGVDRQENEHTLRTYSGATLVSVESRSRVKDLSATTTGAFGELTYALAETQRVVGGVRYDRYSADRYNATTGAAIGDADESLAGGFLRYEHDLSTAATAYVGLGRGQRAMDHWEATTYNGILANRQLDPETNNQLDAGLLWRAGDVSASVSAYYSKIDDFVLTHSHLASAGIGVCPTGTPTTGTGATATYNCAFNVDATRYGLEADTAWRFVNNWTLRGGYAYVRADNDSMNVALAQTPPQELRLGLDYAAGPISVGGLVRMVDKQDRVHVGYGSIVGLDIGETSGFATLALNGSYRVSKMVLVSAGVDNVFDRSYAEHISRAGATVSGYNPATTRVNEPGRFIWIKLNLALN
jgi:iron complex outermembrane recepter protein